MALRAIVGHPSQERKGEGRDRNHRVPEYSEKEYRSIKSWRVAIQKQTRLAVLDGKYSVTGNKGDNGDTEKTENKNIALTCHGNRKTLQSVQQRVSVSITDGTALSPAKPATRQPKVLNNDTLLAAKALVLKGFSPVILNMANARTPGGGYRGGSGAQEENLHRRTNLEFCLDHEVKEGRLKYPIPDLGCIYTAKTMVFRGAESDGYPFLTNPYEISVLSSAAPRRPRVKGEEEAKRFKVLIKKKIQAVIRVALHNGHDAIVLGAWGCGAYKNPPRIVAGAMSEVIREEGGDAEIVVAIIEDHNSRKNQEQGGTSVIDVFREEIERK